jgi:hypothetical protein
VISRYFEWRVKPILNLEETPGKIVGREPSRSEDFADYDKLVAASRLLMPRLPFKKGVYRFHTHEEAHAWTQDQILKAALSKARGLPSEQT